MTKTTSQNLMAALSGRKVAASLLITGAIGILATPVHAQQASPPRLTMTKPAAAPAESLETPKVEVFHSAPTLPRPESAPAPKAVPDAQAAQSEAAPTSTAQFKKAREEDMPFVLGPDLRPWPLVYNAPGALNALYFSLPAARDARIMLPGRASDEADQARFTASRYVTDNIGSAAQARGRQLELLTGWIANYDKQKKLLPKDPWAAYQFSQESLPVIQAFKEKILGQTTPTVERMVQDVTAGVAKIDPVMEAASAYEVKLQWYNVLLQLKEGVGLYQARASEADRQILDVIAAFEDANPPVTRPAGAPPRPGEATAMPGSEMTRPMSGPGISQPREQAKPVPVQPPPSKSGGIIVLLGICAVVLGLFMKLRKRVANKGSAKTDSGK